MILRNSYSARSYKNQFQTQRETNGKGFFGVKKHSCVRAHPNTHNWKTENRFKEVRFMACVMVFCLKLEETDDGKADNKQVSELQMIRG